MKNKAGKNSGKSGVKRLEKTELHARNKHRERYDFEKLKVSLPELASYLRPNKYDDESIDFSNPNAVKVLNRALLKCYYNVDFWEVPSGYLSPPIPGRADYLHHIADLLAQYNDGVIPRGKEVVCFDIGVGANCIYPIVGVQEYGWSFIGSDCDPVAISAANQIVKANPFLAEHLDLRFQNNCKRYFSGILEADEFVNVVICNPPFHASKEEAQAGTLRKLRNLNKTKVKKAVLNFGGQHGELWCEGGEKRFINDMIYESRRYANQCVWFSTLVSKKSNLTGVFRLLKKVDAAVVKTLPMGQGNKMSRVVAWTFQSNLLNS